MNLIPDPGFEKVPSDWTLGTTCTILGAVIQSAIKRTGNYALSITQNRLFPIKTTCGYAQIDVPGFVIGRTYKVTLYHRASNSYTGRFFYVYLDFYTRILSVSACPVGYWQKVESDPFVATAETHNIRIWINSGSSPILVRYFDDLWLDSGDVLDEGDPSSLAVKGGAGDPSSHSGIVSSPEIIRSAARSLGINASASSASLRAKAKKPVP